MDFTTAFEVDAERFSVRPARRADIETLRVWKNANRAAFFTKEEISPEQQEAWFEAFSKKTDQQMFVFERAGKLAGCVGFRFVAPGEVDLFNLILGDGRYGRKGVISAFYRCLESELAHRGVERIQLRVLSSNAPGIAFYRKHGFAVCETDPTFLRMNKTLG